MAVMPYACDKPCQDCDTPSACEFLRETQERADEQERSAQMLAGVLLWMLLVCVAGAIWALAF